MSIKEILEELPKLTPEERQEIRDFLDAEEFRDTDELIKAVDEGFQSSETEQSLSVEEVRELVRCRPIPMLKPSGESRNL
jgi:hypothetical protein